MRNSRTSCVSLIFSVLLLWAGLPFSAAAQTAQFDYALFTLGGGFDNPYGVAVDVSGNVYVADENNNTVKEMPPGCASSTCVVTLGGGFAEPLGVAVDGSGNVYVGDYLNSAVKKIPPGCTVTSCVITLGGGFNEPIGVAVDGSGNVYVADQGNSLVKEMPASCMASTCVTTLGGGFDNPYGVAVDGSGNVYVADYENNAVKEMPPGCATSTCVTTLGGGFNRPSGVAVDGFGNVFVADYMNNALKEMPPGCMASTCVVTLGTLEPRGIAVDGSDNVFVSLRNSSNVQKVETASVDFGTVAIGQTSAAITLTYTVGTAGTPVALTQGVTGLDFAVPDGVGCVAGSQEGTEICSVNVTFTPEFAGLRKGAVLLNSGSSIATGYVHGIGSGPQVSFLPGSLSTLGGGFNYPTGAAVDGNGDVFVADAFNNGVKRIPAGCTVTSCVTTLGGGFSQPRDVALDGAGNVYVADTHNNAVKQSPSGCTVSSCVITLGGGFSGPFGVAVDNAGNVFVADTYNNAVKEIPRGCLASICVKTLGSGFSYPTGVAVDGSGNVFVADFDNNAVQEIPAAGGYSTVKTLGEFNYPAGIAVDGNGNLFVTDTYNDAVKEILAAGGYTTVVPLGSGYNDPVGIAVDGSGNVYVADTGNSRVVEWNFATPPSLSFGSVNVGAESAEQTVTLQNIGNAPLALEVPSTARNPSITTNFTLDASALTSCPLVALWSAPVDLAAAASCTLAIAFAPTVSGSIGGSVVLKDNALNAASPSYTTQTIALTGTGVATPATMTTPAPGSTLGNTNVTFTWSAGTDVTAYEFFLGTAKQTDNLYYSGKTTATTVTVPSIPANSATVYVELCSEINGSWYCDPNYTYTEGGTPAVIQTPAPGSTLGATNVTFTWSAGVGATSYQLFLGTAKQTDNLYYSGKTTATTVTVPSIPANSATVYVELCSEIGGVWKCDPNYTYTEQ